MQPESRLLPMAMPASAPAPAPATAAAGLRDARRILAVRLDNIGDVVMLGPSLRAIRAANPRASITLLASPAGAQGAALLPWLDDVIVHRAVWQDARGDLPLDPARELAFAQDLASRRFDAALIFTSFSQTPWAPAYAAYLAGIPMRAAQASDFGGSLLTDVVPAAPGDGHQAERNLNLIAGLGLPVHDADLEIAVSDAARAEAAMALRAAGLAPGSRYVLLAPGASCDARRPDPVRLADAARMLRATADVAIVIAGAERDRPRLAPLLDPSLGFVDVVGATTVPGLAALVEQSALVICANSAPIHLADALNVPMVVLYSGTDLESQWRPRRAPSVLLRQPTPCSPCYRFECPYRHECLDIPAAAVVDAALTLLDPSLNPARMEVECVPFAS